VRKVRDNIVDSSSCSSKDDKSSWYISHTKRKDRQNMAPLRNCYSERLIARVWDFVLSSAVITPFTRMGSFVIVCSHLTSWAHIKSSPMRFDWSKGVKFANVWVLPYLQGWNHIYETISSLVPEIVLGLSLECNKATML
jgi:hypothetical protein